MAAATASQSKKMAYEFTIDDDELEEDQKSSTDQGTMCNFYKLNLPANASILSKQIAKSQAKRAKKVDRTRQRKDLSVVREENSEENSLNASPRPVTASEDVDVVTSAPASQYGGGRSRIDAAPLDVKLQRQASLPEERREMEPMDDEEAELLAMLLRGIERNEQRKAMASLNLNSGGNQPIQNPPNSYIQHIPPSPGLPRLPPGAKVSEWLLERSTSPDNLSVVSSVLLEDSGLVLNYQNSDEEDDDEVDIFYDAEEEKVVDVVNSNSGVDGLEHEMQGLSLNRNMTAMTQSLVRVEEETTTTDGTGGYDINGGGKTGRSTSVSPRPTNNEQFMRNSNGSATFNVKHSSTLARLQKLTPSPQQQQINGNSNNTPYETPLSSRTTRSVLRVHNVNSTPRPQKQNSTTMSKSSVITTTTTSTRRAVSGIRMPPPSPMTTPVAYTTPKSVPPTLTIYPSTPSRPPSVASSIGTRSGVNMTSGAASNLEGLQDLIQMQEEALRRAAQGKQETERKMSWHSDQDANRQSTSTHSSLGSLCSSKSIDGAYALNKPGATPGTSRIPTPRSRLPTPRGSTLPKRVHSVAAAVRFATSKPESTTSGHTANQDVTADTNADECF